MPVRCHGRKQRPLLFGNRKGNERKVTLFENRKFPPTNPLQKWKRFDRICYRRNFLPLARERPDDEFFRPAFAGSGKMPGAPEFPKKIRAPRGAHEPKTKRESEIR